MTRILIGTDGSESAGRALEFAAALAQRQEAELCIINVIGGQDRPDEKALEELARQEHNSVGDLSNAFSEQILARALGHARGLGVAVVRARSGQGDPAKTILEIAEQEEARAIVVGRRGRGRLAGLLLGSVSQKLATLAPCVVMIVP